MKTTLTQANQTIETADSLFHRAAKTWERGNNSGNSETLKRCEEKCDAFRVRAEKLLAPFGVCVDYTGLYPSFDFGGISYHTTESAVSAALQAHQQVLIDTAALAVRQLNGDAAWLESSNQSRVAIGTRKIASQLTEAINAVL